RPTRRPASRERTGSSWRTTGRSSGALRPGERPSRGSPPERRAPDPPRIGGSYRSARDSVPRPPLRLPVRAPCRRSDNCRARPAGSADASDRCRPYLPARRFGLHAPPCYERILPAPRRISSCNDRSKNRRSFRRARLYERPSPDPRPFRRRDRPRRRARGH
ncbi:hypothetical protein KXW36_001285, partial [Aspergillus fumigatus]